MKDNKYEMRDLDANDRMIALAMLLIKKGIITESELLEVHEMVLQSKNEELEKQLKSNPGFALMFGMMNKS